jgi:hypothetical protein
LADFRNVSVEALACVTLNGKDLGVLWHPPYRAEITDALKPGTDALKPGTNDPAIVVTTWHKRRFWFRFVQARTMKERRAVISFGSPAWPPPNLDYDRWLGPTPLAAYTRDRVHPQGDDLATR